MKDWGDQKANLNVRIPRQLRTEFNTYVTSKELNMTVVTEALVRMYMDMTEEQKEKLLEKYS